MDYTTLIAEKTVAGSIKAWINYDRIDPAEILTEAEAWIYAKLRVREMTETASVSIASGASTASLPMGYRDPIQFGIPGYNNALILRDIEWFRTHLGFDQSAVLPTGLPTYWVPIGTTIHLNTLADMAYTASMTYYKTPAALSASNETNFLTEKYPTLLRRACLMFAAEYRKEYDIYDRSEMKALQAIAEISVESDLGMRGAEYDFNWQESR